MPGFNFRLSDGESEDVFEYILDQGGCLIPDEQYPTHKILIISTKDDLTKFRGRQVSPQFFIIKVDYVEAPFILRTINKGPQNQQVTFISQRYGGPYIGFVWLKSVKQGSCYYYPYYFYEEVEYYKHRPPEAMVQFYKDIFKYIRKKCVIVKYYGSRIYCGKEYLAQVHDGTIEKVETEFKSIVSQLFE